MLPVIAHQASRASGPIDCTRPMQCQPASCNLLRCGGMLSPDRDWTRSVSQSHPKLLSSGHSSSLQTPVGAIGPAAHRSHGQQCFRFVEMGEISSVTRPLALTEHIHSSHRGSSLLSRPVLCCPAGDHHGLHTVENNKSLRSQLCIPGSQRCRYWLRSDRLFSAHSYQGLI